MCGLPRGPQVKHYIVILSWSFDNYFAFVRLRLHPDGGLQGRGGRREGVGWYEDLWEESEGTTTNVRVSGPALRPPTDPVDHQFEDLH